MGTGASRLSLPEPSAEASSSCGLGDLPESCVSAILTLLEPPEICQLARVCRSFHRASSSDFVWEAKLPCNYSFLVERVLGESPEQSAGRSKKEIYAKLCSVNRFDNGTKEVWLDRRSSKLFMAISPKALKITGIHDRRYWQYLPSPESRFHVIAYLQQVWWFEVVGEEEFVFPPGKYSLYFRLQLGKPCRRFGRRASNFDRVHGWERKPVRFQLSTSDCQHASSECYLGRSENWLHQHVGDFVVDEQSCETPFRIKFSMLQIDCTHTKGGLCLDSVIICPSEFRDF